MKRIFLYLFILALSNFSIAQSVPTFNKIYQYPNSFSNLSSSIVPCKEGYILYGEEIDSTHFSRVTITKIDTLGNLLWTKSYGKKDSNYWNIYPGGGGGASIPWGGYIGVGFVFNDTNITFGTWDKLALFRFDNNGDTVWTRIYNDSARLEGWYIKIARHNRYLLGCNWFQQKTYYFYTPAITLIDSSGNRLWTKTYNAAPNHARMLLGIDTCKDGGYILTTYDYDTNYPGQEQANIVIIKTDSMGNPKWIKFIPPPYYLIEGWNIMSLKEGGYIVCGEQGTRNNLPDNYPLLYMAKLNDTGSIVWSKTYGPPPREVGFDVLAMAKELPNGDIISCGVITDTLLDTMKGCILRVDSIGNEKWLHSYYMQSPQEQDYLFDIEPTKDGGFIACGSTNGATQNTWVVKVDSLGCDSGCNYTGIEEIKTNSEEIRVFPNPSNGIFTITLSHAVPSYSGSASQTIVEIYNVMGQKVTIATLKQVQGDNLIDLSAQPNGIYLYRVVKEDGGLVGEGKVVIQK